MLSLFSSKKPMPDFSRHQGLLDRHLTSGTRIACVGTGGAAGVIKGLVGCGVGTVTLIDHDVVSATNPTTQAHALLDVGKPKVLALAAALRAINPAVKIHCHPKPYEELTASEHAELWGEADLMLAMTDRFDVQAKINRDALAAHVTTLFAICYIGCAAVEITVTDPDTVDAGGGCHHCHTKARYDAYASGFKNPATISSHALAADYLNALIGNLALGILHYRAGVSLPFAALGKAFLERPCLISRMLPDFGEGPGGAFDGLPPSPFMTRLFALDTPAGWMCPDCGTPGVVPVQLEFPRPTLPIPEGAQPRRGGEFL